MSLSAGIHVQISVYRVDKERSVAYGFSTDFRRELIVRVTENDGVHPGYSLAFTVQRMQGKVVVPEPNSMRVHQLEACKIVGHTVEFPTMAILSSKSPKEYEFWSPDFGFVLLRDDYHATRDITYSTYVKRDYSDRAMNGNYLFSICANLKQVEQGKKENLLPQLRDEEDQRQRSVSPAAFGTSGFQRSNNERWWDNSNQGGNVNGQSDSQADLREREMKAMANDVTSFLVVSLAKQGAKVFGEAWCSPVRTVVLTCDKFSGSTQKIEVGKWYEGVVKYSKRHYQKTNGFYVEKVWRESESPTTLNTKVDRRDILVHEDIHFQDSLVQHVRRNAGLYFLTCSSLMSVQMTEKQFTSYEGQTRTCVMQYIPTTSPELCNWKLVEVLEDFPRMGRQQGEEQERVEGEDHGPDRCDQFDDDDDDDDDEDMVPRAPRPPLFGNQPNAGVQRPIPHRADQQSFMGNLQNNAFGSYNNGGASSSNRENWNFPNSDSGFVDATGRNPMGYGVRGQYYAEEEEVSDFGVVTESATRSFIIYSNRTQACFVRDVPLTLGDWVQFRARKLMRKEGGCWYEAIPASISKTDQLNPVFVDNMRNYIWLDVTVRMQYGTRPHPVGEHFKVNTSDVGWVSSEYQNMIEPEGYITMDEMKGIGGEWRVYVQFIYSDDDYEWWIMRVRGQSEEVATRDKANDLNNLKKVAIDEEDLEIERQKAAAKAQMEMEQMNLGGSSRSSSRQAPGLFSGHQNAQSPSDSSMNAPSSLSKADLLALWQINEVRTALKTTDYDLYDRVERSVADARQGGQTPVQRGPSQGLPMSSHYSNPQSNSSMDRLRSAFGPSHNPSVSSRGHPPQQNHYGPSSSSQNHFGPSSSQNHYGPSSSSQNHPPSGGFKQNYNNNRFM